MMDSSPLPSVSPPLLNPFGVPGSGSEVGSDSLALSWADSHPPPNSSLAAELSSDALSTVSFSSASSVISGSSLSSGRTLLEKRPLAHVALSKVIKSQQQQQQHRGLNSSRVNRNGSLRRRSSSSSSSSHPSSSSSFSPSASHPSSTVSTLSRSLNNALLPLSPPLQQSHTYLESGSLSPSPSPSLSLSLSTQRSRAVSFSHSTSGVSDQSSSITVPVSVTLPLPLSLHPSFAADSKAVPHDTPFPFPPGTASSTPRQNVRVVCRFRPVRPETGESVAEVHQLGYAVELDSRQHTVTVRPRKLDSFLPSGSAPASASDHIFSFDHVFDLEAKQEAVFLTAAAPLVRDLISGFNCTIFACKSN